MEYKLLGVKFNVINVILCIALGFLICAMLGYNNKKIIEGANPKKHTGVKKRRARKRIFTRMGKTNRDYYRKDREPFALEYSRRSS